MLRKLFIPLVLVLFAIAALLYFLFGTRHTVRDVRDAVRVEQFQLRNGLTVVVMPNDRLPAVTHLLIIKAGGADDPYGNTGVAHYIEHLMFAGTKDNPAGTYERAVARQGGEQNAFTGYDYTGYYATVPRDRLEEIMQLELDRLQNLAFTPEQAARELKVITEERHMRVENNPGALFDEQLDAITFLNHPYGRPLIGWAEDMAQLRAADAQRFFNRYYKPDNMVLVVAGDVDVRQVRKLAQRYYGQLPAGKTAPRAWPAEPPLRLERHATMRDATVQTPRLVRQYIAPSLKEGASEHALPLAVLAEYLGGGVTSRLYQALVREQQLAVNVSAGYDQFRLGPSLLVISATPRDGVSLEALEAALDRELQQILQATPDAAAVTRAKTQMKAAAIFAQDGLQPLAMLMGSLYAIGLNEQYFYDWVEAVEGVSGPEMLAAAQHVLQSRRQVTGYLLPEKDAAAPMENTRPASPVPSDEPPAMEAEDDDAA